MIEKIDGTELSNVYRQSLPKALALIVEKINQLIILSNNKKPLFKPDIHKMLLEGLTRPIDTNPNIRISKDIWI